MSCGFAFAAFAASLWLLVCDAMATRSDSVLLGAETAMVRGDLWSTAALVAARELPPLSVEAGPDQRKTVETVRELATRAVSRSPANARVWLLLARVAAEPAHRAEFLKMSYLTGQNDLSLVPQRLMLATRLPADADPMLADFTALEIQTLLRRAPSFKGAIANAYKTANAEGRALIEKTLETFDRELLLTIRAANNI